MLYTQDKLTYGGDKLAAIEGIAQAIQAGTGDEYVFGLWRRDLERQLYWYVDFRDQSSYSGPLQSGAPSWSWASVNGRINLPTADNENSDVEKTLIRVTDVDTAPIRAVSPEAFQQGKLQLVCSSLVYAKDIDVSSARWFLGVDRLILFRLWSDVSPGGSEKFVDRVFCLPIIEASPSTGVCAKGLILQQSSNGVKGYFERIGMFETIRDSVWNPLNNVYDHRVDSFKYIKVMKDPRCQVDESTYEGRAGLNDHGEQMYKITLV